MTRQQWVADTTLRIRRALFESGTRDNSKPVTARRVVTWANGVTLLRFLCLPLLVYLVAVRSAFGLSFICLLILAAMDVGDGYLARRLNQVTQIGSVIDPLTDRITIMTITLTFVAVGIMPWWLCAVIVVRDIVLGIIIATIHHGKMPIPVTRAAKAGTLAILVGVPGLLLGRTEVGRLLLVRIFFDLLIWLGVLLYYISLSQYIRVGIARKG